MPTLLVRNIAHLADRQADQMLDLSGHIVMPGMVNIHPPPHVTAESHTDHGAGQGDPLAALVMCGPFRVDYSFISGREIIAEGHFRHLDVDGLLAKHQTVMDRIYDQ
ncbi:hypothetical protein [Neorhizobium petrolearium]|uniref:hypothetical protein n=1 Tax=Neorhizobium petrolearium TaxID=515361 RepID=UPI003F15B784